MNGVQIESLLKSIVYKIYQMYPDVEWDDLEAQAWLIVTEKIDKWDPSRASLATFLHHQILRHLQLYVQRYVLKELNMNGHRSHIDYAEDSHGYQEESRLDAKMTIDKMLEESQGVSRDIIELMLKGYTQSDVAIQLGFSRQYVAEELRKLRGKYMEV